jgi:hypothetical protein
VNPLLLRTFMCIHSLKTFPEPPQALFPFARPDVVPGRAALLYSNRDAIPPSGPAPAARLAARRSRIRELREIRPKNRGFFAPLADGRPGGAFLRHSLGTTRSSNPGLARQILSTTAAN